MADIYTISMEDAVSGNAYRIAQAYVEVSLAAKRMRNAVVNGDAALVNAARQTQQLANNELRAARAAQTAGNAIAKLGPKVGVAAAATRMHDKDMKAANTTGMRFSYTLNALANSAVNLGFALARRLTGAIVDAGQSLYDTADLANRAHLSFANFFGGQASGDKMLKESIEIAKRYGFSIEDIVKQVQRFGAAGFSPEQSKGLLRFGADMMAAGRDVQDVKGIFLAMTQIQGKGKLQAEELTQQLAERGINAGRVWQILSGKLFNGDETKIKEVMALQKKGQIKSGMALNAIVQAGVEGVHGDAIGKAGEGVADKTVGGLGRRMGTLWEDAIFQAVDKANPALVKGMQALFGGAEKTSATSLQGNLTTALESIGGFLEKVGPQLPVMADNFSKAFSAAAGFDAKSLDHFAAALPGIAKDLGSIAGYMVTIASMMAKIASFTLSPQAGVGNAFGMKGMAEQVSKGESPGQKLTNWFASMGESVFGSSPESVGQNVADGLANGMLKNAPAVGKAAESLGQDAIDSSKDTLGVQSPSKVYMGIGGYMAQGLAMGMDQNVDLAMHSAAMMANATIGSSAGAAGLDSRRAIAAGSAAGGSFSSHRGLTVRVGDVYVGTGGAGGAGADAGEAVRSYFETEFVSMLERHLEGVGA